jgi:hypothetical protein
LFQPHTIQLFDELNHDRALHTEDTLSSWRIGAAILRARPLRRLIQRILAPLYPLPIHLLTILGLLPKIAATFETMCWKARRLAWHAAALILIHPKTLQRYARKGLIPGVRVGKLWRFRASEIYSHFSILGAEPLDEHA